VVLNKRLAATAHPPRVHVKIYHHEKRILKIEVFPRRRLSRYQSERRASFTGAFRPLNFRFNFLPR